LHGRSQIQCDLQRFRTGFANEEMDLRNQGGSANSPR
jgi:hypothetical protein